MVAEAAVTARAGAGRARRHDAGNTLVSGLGTTWEEHRRMLEQHRPFADLLIEIVTDDAGLRSVASVRGTLVR